MTVAVLSDSTCILEAQRDKLDIKRRKSGILHVFIPIGLLLKLAIMTDYRFSC